MDLVDWVEACDPLHIRGDESVKIFYRALSFAVEVSSVDKLQALKGRARTMFL